MISKGIIAAAFSALGLASMSHAEGLTFRLEGGLGFNFGQPVGIFSIARDMPATDDTQLNFDDGMNRGPLSFSYRAEGNWAFDLGNGTQMRLGGIVAGVTGTSKETTPLYAFGFAGPGGAEPEKPLAEINICGNTYPEPCGMFEGELARSYREVMPEVMFGRDDANGATTWVGLQGFSGKLSEDTVNSIYRLPPRLPSRRTTLTGLDADVTGVMLAAQQERKLNSGMTLLLGAGIGRYDMDVTGFSVNPALPANTKLVSASFDGTRIQLMAGLEKPLNDPLTLGATVRADHWTNQPRIKMDWNWTDCTISICSPPGLDGNFNLDADPYTSMTFGLSLTWRM